MAVNARAVTPVLVPAITAALAGVCAVASVTGSAGVTAGNTALAFVFLFGVQACSALFTLSRRVADLERAASGCADAEPGAAAGGRSGAAGR